VTTPVSRLAITDAASRNVDLCTVVVVLFCMAGPGADGHACRPAVLRLRERLAPDLGADVRPPLARAAGRFDVLDDGFAGALGQYLVGLAQEVAQVFSRDSQSWFARVFSIRVAETLPPDGLPCRRARAAGERAAGAAGGDLGVGGYGACHRSVEVDVIEAVAAQERGVRHHGEVPSVDLVAHVHLPCETVEDLRQGLVDGVEGDVPVRPGWMSMLIRASRASAKSRSWMFTPVTTTE
jgi:hypothetical protein